MKHETKGPLLALLSAALFGISPVLAKGILGDMGDRGDMSPILLAGLLYLGSGLGLHLYLWTRGEKLGAELRALPRSHWPKLLGAIVAGGLLAPLCFVYGIQLGSAFEVSLLLNLETVATTVLAWLLFHEHVSRRVWAGKGLLVLGAILLSVNLEHGVAFSLSGLLLLGACALWGLDNNLTRDVDELSPAALACIKGWVAGAANTALALAWGAGSVRFPQLAGSVLIGAFSYGASLLLFIQALRTLGASRTSTYFSSAPFFGMALSVAVLGERPGLPHWISALLMVLGLVILYGESHAHSHSHETVTHRHPHAHDEHHQHPHAEGEADASPHEHLHTHEPLVHSHPHWPDTHHRHAH